MKSAQFTPRFNTSGAQFVPSWLEESAPVELTGDNVTQTNTSSSGAIILPVILTGDNVTQTNSSTTGAISVPGADIDSVTDYIVIAQPRALSVTGKRRHHTVLSDPRNYSVTH